MSAEKEPVLEVLGLSRQYRSAAETVEALHPVSFTVHAGETLGIIGESGSGKSTLLRLVSGLLPPTAGMVRFAGRDTAGLRGRARRDVRANMQMIFQNAAASFNPRRKMRSSIEESMRILGPPADRAQRDREIDRLLARVGIARELADRYPANVSGGQCQRIAIARALAVRPRLLLCDEITSALDFPVQREIIGLLRDLREETGVAVLFVSHDLALARSFCDRVLVLYQGRCVDSGGTEQVLAHPGSPHTKRLLDSAIDPIAYLRNNREGDGIVW